MFVQYSYFFTLKEIKCIACKYFKVKKTAQLEQFNL